MLAKARRAIAILDVHDAEKREAFLRYRRAEIPDYDARYEGLQKHFYERALFEAFARKHGLSIRFAKSPMQSYWNAPFVFDVYMTREV